MTVNKFPKKSKIFDFTIFAMWILFLVDVLDRKEEGETAFSNRISSSSYI